MMVKRIISGLVMALLVAGVSQIACADTITTLFNTGVNDAGVPLENGELELHYSIVSGPVTGTPFVRTSAGGFPIGPWMADNSVSAWICPTSGTHNLSGIYTFRTTFDLTGFDISSASITGQWSTDDSGMDILINGVSTGYTNGSYSEFTPFNINSGFVEGINTLDFVVNDVLTIGGLRVELKGDANPVPVPASIVLLGGGLVFLAGIRLRKITGSPVC